MKEKQNPNFANIVGGRYLNIKIKKEKQNGNNLDNRN